MSNQNNQKETPKQENKVMTKYDRKMQAYQEQEKKEKAQKRRGIVLGVAIVVIVAAFVLSFPIRNFIAVNGTYITVGGEKVTKVEFDYNYAMARSSFISQNSYYLSMMGMDTSNIDDQMYSTDLTFRDYFEQLAVGNIQSTKAMKAAAQEAGFSYNTDEEYAQTMEDLKDRASENGTTLNKYLKSVFGSYATQSRLEDVIREGILTTAYYEQVAEASGSSDAEIVSYYEENKQSYDLVDYHMTIVEADLPTAAPDGSTTVDENGNEVAYEPTEEEIAGAMADAREAADAAEDTILADGDPYEGQSSSSVNYLIREWLFDETRVKGDTTVVEDTTGNRYLVVGFDQRYRDETPTVDMRAVVTQTGDAQSILAEWQSGEATEESFIELCGKYDENGVEEGLYEGVEADSMSEDMNAWMADTSRQAGDTAAFTDDNGYNYVFYYLGTNDPAWKMNIYDLLLSQTMSDYLDTIAEGVAVEDPKGNLNYLKVEAAASEAAAAASEEAGSAESSADEAAEESSEGSETQDDSAEDSQESAE